MSHTKKRLTISYKFSVLATLVSIVVVAIAYITLNMYKSTMIQEVYESTKKGLLEDLDEKIMAKKDVGITNAFSIANDDKIKAALKTDDRNLAITSLDTINQTFKDNTQFKNIQVHIHT